MAQDQGADLESNNPYRPGSMARTCSQDALQTEQQQSLDSEKQVVSSEVLSGAENAPTPVDTAPPAQESPEASREADKVVLNSWQTASQEQSSPISMVYHESNSPSSPRSGRLFNDIKGPPPAYEASTAGASSGADSTLAPAFSPTTLEAGGPDDILPPRPEDKSAVGQLLSWIPPTPHRASNSARLSQPVVIPQLDVPPQREAVPFQRCYSDALAAHNVSMQDFARFLDGLEVAQLPNSALQGLRMFGVGVSQLPIPILGTLTGNSISALASSGSGHSGSRARLYMEQARERYFKPRGLRVSIVKDDDLNPRLQIPAHAPRLGMLTQNTLTATCCQRRLEGLSPYVAPLRFDVPDQDKQIRGVQKMARKHLDSRFKESARRIDKLRRKQWGLSSSLPGTIDERYRAKLSDIRAAQDALIREAASPGWQEKGSSFEQAREDLRAGQHELQLVASERQNLRMDEAAVAAEMQEAALTRKLTWLVIECL